MNNVRFGSIKSYTDLGLMLTDVDIATPEPRRVLVDVPGRDGSLDLTSALFPKIKYKNRTIKLEFARADYGRRWISLFSEIVRAIHGKQLQVIIEPDTGYYWDAFCVVDTAKNDRNKGIVNVTLDAYPYKYKVAETSVNVLAAYAGTSVILTNSGMPVKPKFLASSAVTITYDGKTYNLPANTETIFDDIVLTEFTTELIVTGTGTVTITYREGIL